MSDDILDAAQKAVNDAAQQAENISDVPPAETAPVAPQKTQQLEASVSIEEQPAPTPMQPPVVPNPVEASFEAEHSERIIVPSANPPKHHSSMGQKKSGKGPLLALIALLLLVMPVSVYFISKQNQQLSDVRSRATGTTYGGYGDPCSSTQPCANGYTCSSTLHTCQPNTDLSCGRNNDPGAPVCCNADCPSNNQVCEPPNRRECNMNGVHCTINANDCTPPGDDTGDDTVENTPTPTTGTAPICQNIKLYKDGTQLTDLPSLRGGDDVVLAVKGNLSPTKAHFRVNGGAWTETTTTNSSGEFTWAYTIPDDVTEFVIEGEVFTNGAWR